MLSSDILQAESNNQSNQLQNHRYNQCFLLYFMRQYIKKGAVFKPTEIIRVKKYIQFTEMDSKSWTFSVHFGRPYSVKLVVT